MTLWKSLLALAAVLAGALLMAGPAMAVGMPDRSQLEKMIGEPPIVVRVVEPHLSTPQRAVQVEYLGYPAPRVLAALLGASWNAPGQEVEFRALDGYVSRIPTERFARYRAFLVFGRMGQSEFVVDNITQNEKRVALGPYYLVWDNLGSPELVAEGGSFWPYQVAQVLTSSLRQDALLPGAMAPRFSEHAALAQKYCLTCHQVNGYGGEKQPINLAAIVKTLPRERFAKWVTTPAAVKPDTSMPPLPIGLPEAQRQEIAERLYEYLSALPVTR